MLDYRRILRLRPRRASDLHDELEDEIRTHLELRVDEFIAQGLTPEEARAAAEERFGDLDAARRALQSSARRRDRRLRIRGGLDALSRDLRLALRKIRRAPGYAGVSIAILALSIALATVMFTLVDHVLLRPVPFPEPDRLVALQTIGVPGGPYAQVSMANWFDWREGTTGLAATGIVRQDRVSVTQGGEGSRATVAAVGGGFFSVFRPRVAAGRVLTEGDGQEIRQVTVISTAFALDHFGTPAEALGGVVGISGRPYEVVGVLEPGQGFPEGSDLWVAFYVSPGSGLARNSVNFSAYARLDEEAEPARIGEELNAVARGIRETDPEGAFHSHGVHIEPLQAAWTSEAAGTLWLLMAGVVVILLLACANLAGLGLARARTRGPEVAVRRALGSGQGPIVRQILVEHLVLATVGGALGFGLATLVGEAVFPRLAGELPRTESLAIDLRVALFAAVLTVGAGLLAGIIPALRAARHGRRARGAVTGGKGLPGGALVALEVGLALAVLIGGGLLLRSLHAVADRELGFDPGAVAVAEVDLNGDQYRDGLLAVDFWTALIDELEERPGVEAAAVANWIPTGSGGTGFLAFPDNPDPGFGAGYRVVSEGYFETLGIALRAGRVFDGSDGVSTERVAVVNRALADRAWPGQNPIGQSVASPSMEAPYSGGEAPWLRVVGVVDDIRDGGYEDELTPELYVLYSQMPRWTRGMNVVVRGSGAAGPELAALVREVIRAPDPSLAVEVGWLGERVSELLRERVWTQRILGGFGLVSLLMVCLGIYGIVAYAAVQRTREMAVRAALGAQRTGLLGLMLYGAARVLAAGTALGLVAAYGVAGWMESLLFDVPAGDPVTFLGAAALLAGVGLFAAFVPSFRAARLDPTQALRAD